MFEVRIIIVFLKSTTKASQFKTRKPILLTTLCPNTNYEIHQDPVRNSFLPPWRDACRDPFFPDTLNEYLYFIIRIT